MKVSNKDQRGFTLIEILVVIGIIAILAAIVIIAINPARQFAQARNSQRVSNVNAILNAVGQNLADNKGVLNCPGVTITSSTSTIGTSGANLASCLVPTYIPSMVPKDPGGTVGGTAVAAGTDADTGYDISVDGQGRYLICAPNANEDAVGSPGAICVKR